jgi:hypothetical protein
LSPPTRRDVLFQPAKYRLAKDLENCARIAVAFILLASIRLMLRRLARL